MTRITTPRLVIRDVRPEDAQANARLWSDPEVMRYMGGPRKPEEILARTAQVAWEQQQSETGIWVIEDIATCRVLGNCGLSPKNVDGRDELELVYLLFASEWGKGYATEAAREVQKHALSRLSRRQIVALIDPRNAASERVALRLGMRHVRDTLRPNGLLLRLYLAEASPAT